jgi:UDP:flavonoid glycosyltransferase YjiC (YdhE family)
MKKIKVLFIPHPMPSHAIPLLALARMLRKSHFECAFLLPIKYHDIVRNMNVRVLEIDRKLEDKTRPEMIAFSIYQPDVVVDDLSFTTAFSTRLTGIPRISIVRKGIMPYEIYTENYKHSSKIIDVMEGIIKSNFKGQGIWEPQKISDLFIGDINIIPSIPSIEPLPTPLKENPSYIYSGALLLNDNEVLDNLGYLKSQDSSNNRNIDINNSVDLFLNKNKTRKIVYFTVGLAYPEEIRKHSNLCIRSLLKREIAVITNICDFPIKNEEKQLFFSAPYLPMDKICSNVDLMIHQCGSGTYKYQIKHKVPGIILGSKCYDRDDVAICLNKLGAAHYISADLDEDTYLLEFNHSTAQLLDKSSDRIKIQEKSLSKLYSEMIETQKAFDFETVITQVIEKIK